MAQVAYLSDQEFFFWLSYNLKTSFEDVFVDWAGLERLLKSNNFNHRAFFKDGGRREYYKKINLPEWIITILIEEQFLWRKADKTGAIIIRDLNFNFESLSVSRMDGG